MRTDTIAKAGRIVALCGVVLVLFSLFLLAVRPWYLRWGATDEEAHARLPGDELLVATGQSTRAITIDASAERVWPWLLQLGQDRGGFYSYTLLENLFGTNMENLAVLRPELQHWEIGDKLWMYPPDKLGGAGHAVLARMEPARALVFSTRRIGTALSAPADGSWAFVLEPRGAHSTRLLVRGRALEPRNRWQGAFELMVFEPIHFMMERKMMSGIKACAEGQHGSSLEDALQLATYASCFMFFCAAALHLLRWPAAWRWTLVLVCAGLGFQLLTFLQPPWIIGLMLVGMLTALFEFAERAA